MTLSELQRLFPSLVAKLIVFIYANGYECTFGEAYRSDEQSEINALGAFGRSTLVGALKFSAVWNILLAPLARAIENNVGSGIRTSLHGDRLAIDFNLFSHGVFLRDSQAWKFAGDYWKTLHPLARWGGDFATKDGNHFSLEYQGRK